MPWGKTSISGHKQTAGPKSGKKRKVGLSLRSPRRGGAIQPKISLGARLPFVNRLRAPSCHGKGYHKAGVPRPLGMRHFGNGNNSSKKGNRDLIPAYWFWPGTLCWRAGFHPGRLGSIRSVPKVTPSRQRKVNTRTGGIRNVLPKSGIILSTCRGFYIGRILV